MSELKDWLNSINFNKEDLSYDIKDYPPYVINRCLSGFIDTIMYANEMNRYHNLDKDCLLYTSPSPRDVEESRMPSSA